MKKLIAIITIAAFSFLATGCHSSQVIDGTRYEPIGLYHKLADPGAEAPDVRYNVVWGNVIWCFICGTTGLGLVVTVILLGWFLWEPVGPSSNTFSPPQRN